MYRGDEDHRTPWGRLVLLLFATFLLVLSAACAGRTLTPLEAARQPDACEPWLYVEVENQAFERVRVRHPTAGTIVRGEGLTTTYDRVCRSRVRDREAVFYLDFLAADSYRHNPVRANVGRIYDDHELLYVRVLPRKLDAYVELY